MTKLLESYMKPLEPELKLKLAVECAPMNLDAAGSSSTSPFVSDENVLPKPTMSTTEEILEKGMMMEAAIAAKEEVLKLLCTNELLWVKSRFDRKLVLHPKNYKTVFPRVDHFKGSPVRVESSKDSRIVKIKAMQLVDMLLDSVSTHIHNFNISSIAVFSKYNVQSKIKDIFK